jgi:hypothetical protein
MTSADDKEAFSAPLDSVEQLREAAGCFGCAEASHKIRLSDGAAGAPLIIRGSENLLNASAEIGRVDRGKAIEPRLDLLEEGAKPCTFDQPALEHLPDVGQILHVAALDLRERLGVEIEVPKRQSTGPFDEDASLAPALREWEKVRRRRELYVDCERLLQPRDRPEDVVLLRSSFRSTSSVVSRQPRSTAVAPPVR